MAQAHPGAGPLAGVRVIDLSTVVFGPYASQFLADWGADVVKIESPEGDMTRQIGACVEPGLAALFVGVNRNKRSVVIDLKTADGRELLGRLVEDADVVLHNIRPHKLTSIGLEPGALRARNPRLVFAGLHGFGEEGPYAGRPAYDDVVQGLSGLAALMEAQCGEPRYVPTTLADKSAALVAAQAVLAALFARERTGCGCMIEVPMFETVVSFGLVEHMEGQAFDPPTGPMGYRRALSTLRRPMKTLDGRLCIMPYTDAHWHRFFEAAGDATFLADPKFASVAERSRHIEALYQRMAERLAERTTRYWLELCDRHDIPAAQVNSLEDVQRDPHLAATGHFARVDDPSCPVTLLANPVRFDGQRAPLRMPPRHGEHTEQVLREAGLSDVELAQLLAAGVVRGWPTSARRGNGK